jgi:hypothetical protein
MATAVMRIDQATLSAGTDDTSRIDGVPNQTVTLNWVGTGTPSSYLWRFFDYVGAFSVPTISNSSSAVATFVPGGGASGYGQTFGVELVIDGGAKSRRTFKIPTENHALLFPAYSETADVSAALYAPSSAASTDNAGSNWRGWAPALTTLQARADRLLGAQNIVPHPSSVEGNVETLLGAVYLPDGTATIRAQIGCLDASHQATLRIYRDASLVTTLSRTGVLGAVSTTGVSVTAGWHELRGFCGSSIGTALFRGVFLGVR